MDFTFPIIEIKETDSTNRYLNDWCDGNHDQVQPFTLVTSDFQSAGKGQQGNSWESEAGANLTFSFVMYPDFVPAKRQFVISQIVSLGIVEALRKQAPDYADSFSVKWPNDIYFLDKKICGILIETFLRGMNLGRCVCGIGLNVNQKRFLSDAPNPVSLCQIVGKNINRLTLLQDVMGEIIHLYATLLTQEAEATENIRQSYASNLYRRVGTHKFKDAGGEFLARFVKVEPDGRLFLEDYEGKTRSYLFKEVQYII